LSDFGLYSAVLFLDVMVLTVYAPNDCQPEVELNSQVDNVQQQARGTGAKAATIVLSFH
jgi:hypothetical protein